MIRYMLFTKENKPYLDDWDKTYESVMSAYNAWCDIESERRQRWDVHIKQMTFDIGPRVEPRAVIVENKS